MIDGWDKRTLRNKEPCRDCPFRVKALPGYLGGHPLEPYAYPPSVGMPTTCHRTDKGAGSPLSGFCAGSLAMIANDPDVTPLAEYAEAVEAVGPRDDCMTSSDQFREHHARADEFAERTKR